MRSGPASIRFGLRLLTCGKDKTNVTGYEWIVERSCLSGWMIRERDSGHHLVT
jgi:hypothetical protein